MTDEKHERTDPVKDFCKELVPEDSEKKERVKAVRKHLRRHITQALKAHPEFELSDLESQGSELQAMAMQYLKKQPTEETQRSIDAAMADFRAAFKD